MSVKKLVSTLFALAMIAGLMAACASPTPHHCPRNPATGSGYCCSSHCRAVPPTALTASSPPLPPLPFPTWLARAGLSDAEQALAKQFAQQTGITIDFQVIPSDQYFNVLKTKLNSGEGPDIFGGQSGKTDLVVNYDVEKNAVDLSDNHGPRRRIHWFSINQRSMAKCMA